MCLEVTKLHRLEESVSGKQTKRHVEVEAATTPVVSEQSAFAFARLWLIHVDRLKDYNGFSRVIYSKMFGSVTLERIESLVSRETRRVSRETRRALRETRREVVTYIWAVLYILNRFAYDSVI